MAGRAAHGRRGGQRILAKANRFDGTGASVAVTVEVNWRSKFLGPRTTAEDRFLPGPGCGCARAASKSLDVDFPACLLADIVVAVNGPARDSRRHRLRR